MPPLTTDSAARAAFFLALRVSRLHARTRVAKLFSPSAPEATPSKQRQASPHGIVVVGLGAAVLFVIILVIIMTISIRIFIIISTFNGIIIII